MRNPLPSSSDHTFTSTSPPSLPGPLTEGLSCPRNRKGYLGVPTDYGHGLRTTSSADPEDRDRMHPSYSSSVPITTNVLVTPVLPHPPPSLIGLLDSLPGPTGERVVERCRLERLKLDRSRLQHTRGPDVTRDTPFHHGPSGGSFPCGCT